MKSASTDYTKYQIMSSLVNCFCGSGNTFKQLHHGDQPKDNNKLHSQKENTSTVIVLFLKGSIAITIVHYARLGFLSPEFSYDRNTGIAVEVASSAKVSERRDKR
jgi:hypothetical protein